MPDFLRTLLAQSKNWKFDPMTSFMTVVIAPLFLLAIKVLAKHLKQWTQFLWEGVLYWVSRAVIHSLAARLTLRKYARLQLQGNNQYLFVPSRRDIKLEVDKIFVTLQLEHHGGSRETYTHEDLLALSNRLRVMGDPGSGKTSLARRIFRDGQCLPCQGAATRAGMIAPFMPNGRDLVQTVSWGWMESGSVTEERNQSPIPGLAVQG